jgi:large subunit ribosomal protein L24
MAAIRKGDTVKVIAGKEKGKQGRVLEVLREEGRIRVEKLMVVKRHMKKGRSAQNPQGGIVEKDGSIAVSAVMVVKDGAPVRREKIARELGAKEKARLEKRAKGASRAGA